MSLGLDVRPEWRPNLAQWERDDAAASRAALKAVAKAIMDAIKARVGRGYTSGKFARGDTSASIQLSRFSSRGGEPTIRVGSTSFVSRLWEIGHFNRFTRKFERVEHWRQAVSDIQPHLADIYRRAYESIMTLWSTTPSNRRRRRAPEIL